MLIAELGAIRLVTEEGAVQQSGWFDLQIGAYGEPGEDTFGLFVCTPAFLEAAAEQDGKRWGRSMLVVPRFDLSHIKTVVRDRVATMSGKNWSKVAHRLNLFMDWEFEDYQG